MQRSVGSQLSYLPHVDGLRAVAIVLVVAYHAWPRLLPGGYIGVDVFFVISGFIITRQILQEMALDAFSFSAFLGRRLRRLVPASLVCIAIVSVAASVILAPEALIDYGKSAVAAFLMAANVFFYETSGYFAGASAEKPLLHTWSLAVEDQFYLTWPLILLLLLRCLRTRPKVLCAVLGIAALSLLHAQTTVLVDRDYAFYWLMPRAFELLIGCSLAIASEIWRNARVDGKLGDFGLLLIAASAFLLTEDSAVPGLSAIPCCFGAALCIYAGLNGSTLTSRLLSLPPVVFAGKISYSLYLYHWPILALTTYSLGRPPAAGEAAAIVVASFGAAALSWWLVEQRLTQALNLRALAAPKIFGLAAAASGVMCAMGLAMVIGKGWSWRLDDVSVKVYAAAASSNPLRNRCDGYENALIRDSECTFGLKQSGRPLDLAVFGDSNADHFVPMLAELAQKNGLSGRQVTQSTCAAIIGLDRKRPANENEICTRYQEAILAFLDKNPNLKIAVLSGAWGGYQGSFALNRVAAKLGFGSAGSADTFQNIIERAVKIFRDRGIAVILIGQIPHFENFSLSCFAKAARDGRDEACATPRGDVEQVLAPSQAEFTALAKADDKIQFINMIDLLCSATACTGFKDGVFMYRNYGHLNGTGSKLLAKYVQLPSPPILGGLNRRQDRPTPLNAADSRRN